jgi:hypothetical protein
MMHRIHVDFDKKQLNRLLKGHTVQVKAEQLQKSSTTPILITGKQFTVYKRALKLNKGMRFQIAPELMNDNHMLLGAGIKDMWKNAKKTIKDVSNKVYKDAVKPTGKALKDSAKAAAKAFAIDALASDNIRGYAKDNAKRRALEWAQNDALDIAHAGINEGILIGEKELEDALIENHNFDPDLARQMISAGSHRLSKQAYNELMNIDDAINEELMNIAEGAGLRRGRDFTVTRGGKLSFSKFLRGVKRVGQKILKVGKPVLKPLMNAGITALSTAIGNPALAPALNAAAEGGYDALAGSGMRKRGRPRSGAGMKGSQQMKAKMAKVRAAKSKGGALRPAGYRRGGALRPAGM